MKFSFIPGSFLLILLLFTTGCQNTVEGFGKDLQQSGQEIQKSVS